MRRSICCQFDSGGNHHGVLLEALCRGPGKLNSVRRLRTPGRGAANLTSAVTITEYYWNDVLCFWRISNVAFQEAKSVRCAVSGGRHKERLIHSTNRLLLNVVMGGNISTEKFWGGHVAVDDVEDGSFRFI